ncbi:MULTISPECIES: virulence protein RhuM/Fic/DOC family protein [unclassified Adlercreutzia]|uniref:virulence protein RhuM/Fic/DOC family protein n=1 Tax=unclassified Adlercreutzia TaxID=2636013 RepID=UPI0013EB80E8|nr:MULTISPECIES: virulence protein RhuM/Fic/DOC family protein [unclassified Adlercreutzia]
MAEKNASQIVLFESSDGEVALDVAVDVRQEEVWLNRSQMSALFGRDVKTIGKHIANALKEELDASPNPAVAKFATVQLEGDREVRRDIEYYNLDVIISVGYRVKSQRGVEFRRWATDVLRRYVMEGRAENEGRLRQLSQSLALMERVADNLDASQVLEIVKVYATALDLLDDYDHQRVERPKGDDATYVLSYDECRGLIDALRFNDESTLFGAEKDDSFKSSIGAIYQSFGGREIYPSVQEKAANLLYFIVKNHSFHDGNKRIAATIFLYFLDRNGILYESGKKAINDSTLVATTIMIAESRPEEKEMMVSLVMNFLS